MFYYYYYYYTERNTNIIKQDSLCVCAIVWVEKKDETLFFISLFKLLLEPFYLLLFVKQTQKNFFHRKYEKIN